MPTDHMDRAQTAAGLGHRSTCRTEGLRPIDPDFPDPHLPTHVTVTLTGHSPSERRVAFVPSYA